MINPDIVRGAVELERTEHGLLPHRLPAWARAQCDDGQLAMVEAQPAGVRLVFRTRATEIELDVLSTKVAYRGAPPRPHGVYDLVVDSRLTAQRSTGDGTLLTIDMLAGTADLRPGPVTTVRFDGLSADEKNIEIWLPHKETTELVDLRADASVEALPVEGKVWLHHGSSISHGSDADSPTATWVAQAARRSNLELVNLGMGGSALLDPFVARSMRYIAADLISVKIGINLVNADLMRLRAFGPAVHGFLDTIRDGHPDTPLVVVSPIHCPIHEDTPGPGMPVFENGGVRFVATGEPGPGKLTLNVIRDELATIVHRRNDPNLTYLDGRELYGEADFAELPLPDGLHPDTATHARIGERFAQKVLQRVFSSSAS